MSLPQLSQPAIQNYYYPSPKVVDENNPYLFDAYTANYVTCLSRFKRLTSYTGPAFTNRRDSDGGDLDINFLPNGERDYAAALSHAGGGTSRQQILYDQVSGATVTATASDGPIIAESGAIVLNPASEESAYFDGITADGCIWSTEGLSQIASITPLSCFYRISVLNWGDATSRGNKRFLGTSEGPNNWNNFWLDDGDLFRNRIGGSSYSLSPIPSFTTFNLTTIYANGTISRYLDGSLDQTTSSTLTGHNIVANYGFSSGVPHHIDEVHIWTSDQSANRLAIEALLSKQL